MAGRTGTRPLLARLFRRTASTEAVEDRAAALPGRSPLSAAEGRPTVVVGASPRSKMTRSCHSYSGVTIMARATSAQSAFFLPDPRLN
jgi:hypothetical protein